MTTISQLYKHSRLKICPIFIAVAVDAVFSKLILNDSRPCLRRARTHITRRFMDETLAHNHHHRRAHLHGLQADTSRWSLGSFLGYLRLGWQRGPSEYLRALTNLSQIIGLINGTSLTIAAASGIGNHADLLSDHDFSTAMCWVWVGNAATLISISFGKIAVVAFLLTIQGETHSTKRHMLYFLCASTVSFEPSNIFCEDHVGDGIRLTSTLPRFF